MKKTRAFSVKHIPKFSLIFISALKEPLAIFITVTGNTLTLLGTYFFYHFEHATNPNVKSYFDAFWWSMTTVTTVGFGDIVPTTFEGRIVAMTLMVSGILCFFAFTTVIVTVIMGIATDEIESTELLVKSELDELYSRLDRIEKPPSE